MSKRKRLALIGFIIVVALVAVISYFVIQINDNMDLLDVQYIGDVDLSTVPDGDYYGAYEVFPIAVEVKVVVADHAIQSIEILRHQNGRGEAAETIVNDVIADQSLEVDAVAGATYSSKVILLAIKDALTDIS